MISILVGSTLSSDGLLKEPAFFCTPLGYFFLFIALLSVITITCKEHMNQKVKQNNLKEPDVLIRPALFNKTCKLNLQQYLLIYLEQQSLCALFFLQ